MYPFMMIGESRLPRSSSESENVAWHTLSEEDEAGKMEVDLDQRPDADLGDHHGCAGRRAYWLRSLVPLRLAVTTVRNCGDYAVTQPWGIRVGSKVMNGVEGGHLNHYCGYPQLKRMSIIGSELHANQ